MAEDAAARLVQHEIPEVLIPGDPARLLPKRLAGRWRDATDNDVADLSLRMAANGVDDLRGPLASSFRRLLSRSEWAEDYPSSIGFANVDDETHDTIGGEEVLLADWTKPTSAKEKVGLRCSAKIEVGLYRSGT